MPGYWEWIVGKARAGDVSAARDILQTVAGCIQIGADVPASIAEFTLQGFAQYLAKEDPTKGALERALCLLPGAHRPAETDRLLTIRIARRRRKRVAGGKIVTPEIAVNISGKRPISWLVARIHQWAKAKKKSKADAMEWAANRYRVSFDSLQGYERDYSPLRSYDAAKLKSLIYFGRRRVKTKPS